MMHVLKATYCKTEQHGNVVFIVFFQLSRDCQPLCSSKWTLQKHFCPHPAETCRSFLLGKRHYHCQCGWECTEWLNEKQQKQGSGIRPPVRPVNNFQIRSISPGWGLQRCWWKLWMKKDIASALIIMVCIVSSSLTYPIFDLTHTNSLSSSQSSIK